VISIANGEFIGYRRKNSQPSVLAVFTSSKFSKADVQNSWTNFSFRHGIDQKFSMSGKNDP